LRPRALRPQLKRDPLGGHEHELIVGHHIVRQGFT